MKKFDLLLLLLLVSMVLAGTLAYCGSKDSIPSASEAIEDDRESVKLPVLMYHGICSDSSEETEYKIAAERFEGDLQWLQNNGYTTVSVNQLVSYVEEGTALPAKPVLITFDDGYANNYALAFPLLQKYHMKAVISVIGSESDICSGDIYRGPLTGNLNWGEIAIMAASGNIEIGSHTYDLHNASPERKGADKKKGESQEAYAKVLSDDLLKNQKKIETATGTVPLAFAWPFGQYPMDGSANPILKELGFKATFISYQKMNEIRRGDPNSLFGLRRFLRTPDFDISIIDPSNSNDS